MLIKKSVNILTFNFEARTVYRFRVAEVKKLGKDKI